VVGQTRDQPARARDIARERSDRIDGTEHDVVDGARIDTRPLDQRLDDVRAEVGGWTPARLPFFLPTGVRTASMM
jgi:hypothetical protein